MKGIDDRKGDKLLHRGKAEKMGPFNTRGPIKGSRFQQRRGKKK